MTIQHTVWSYLAICGTPVCNVQCIQHYSQAMRAARPMLEWPSTSTDIQACRSYLCI